MLSKTRTRKVSRKNGMKGTALAAALSAACAAPGFASTACVCTGDLNGCGTVDAMDLALLLGSWGQCDDCVADINDSGEVNAADLALLLGAWGPCTIDTFDFGPGFKNAEAEQIGLEMLGANGPLLLPQETYERILTDLELIREEVPALADQGHTLAWAPSQLIVGVVETAPQDEYQCLNQVYQVVEEDPLFNFGGVQYYVLTFAGNVNVLALGQIYAALPEVNSAEPNGLIGGQNFYDPMPQGDGVWLWEIDDGFHDCFDGCDCHTYYVIETTAGGEVTVISTQQIGQSWCEFGS